MMQEKKELSELDGNKNNNQDKDQYKNQNKGQKQDNNKNARLFGTNGIRGVFAKDLTLDMVVDISYSLARYFKRGPIVVGYDGRISSPIISNIVCSALNSAGLDVCDAGLLPTPCLQYCTKKMGFAGGIMITASHNPAQYNGIKPIAYDGIEVPRKDEFIIEDIYYNKGFAPVDGYGRKTKGESMIDTYLEAVVSLVDYEKIRAGQFTIAIDAGNGTQAVVAPRLAKMLGCKVIVFNGNVDGNFPGRGSEPTPDNLSMLSKGCLDAGADFGVAFDGDGDRSIFCDDKGQVHWGDKTGAVIVRYLLSSKHKGAEIVCPINTTMVVSKVAEEAGSHVIYTRVGSVEVSREMQNRKAFIGLEENGGFMYGKINEVRDGAMTTALVLDMLAAEKKSFSELISLLPQIYQYKAKFQCPTRQIADEIVKLCVSHGTPKKVDLLDGAKIWIDDETWVMVRPSGTEPLIRMYAESTDNSLLESKVSEYQRLILGKL